MTDGAYLSEIRIFGCSFSPLGWAECNGQILAIKNYEALFSLLGTRYGGDGRTTFGLPDFRGRSIVHQGDGPGLRGMRVGEKGGRETVTLTESHLPPHNHIASFNIADLDSADSTKAKNKALAQNSGAEMYTRTPAFSEGNEMHPDVITVSSAGSGLAFPSRNPYQVVNVCIALDGVFPPRS